MKTHKIKFIEEISEFLFKPGQYIRLGRSPRLHGLIEGEIYKVEAVTKKWELALKNKYGDIEYVHQSSCFLAKKDKKHPSKKKENL